MNNELLDETITSLENLIEYLAAGIKSEDNFRIGTEHEKFIFTKITHQPVPYAGERSILTLLTGFHKKLDWQPITDHDYLIGLRNPVNGATISLEPGGQFELSGMPLANLHQTDQEISEHIYILKELASSLDLGMIGMGASPKWTLAETPRMPKSRYKIMSEYMPKVGSNGLDMMYRTCTSQVNIDFASETDMATKMRVSMKLQPLATALFASSPFTEKRAPGLQSWRSEVWQHVDDNRTGLLPFVFKPGFSFSDYVQWAIDVPMYFVIRDGIYYDCTDITFRQFMKGALRGRLADWRPKLRDWDHHLSTLFPEVRLKQYLEMRGADGGMPDRVVAVAAFWTGLLSDRAALQAIDAFTSEWPFAAVSNLRKVVPWQGLAAQMAQQPLIKIAAQVLDISRNGLKARARFNDRHEDETIFLAPLAAILDQGKTLADEMRAAYHSVWNHSVEPCFETYSY